DADLECDARAQGRLFKDESNVLAAQDGGEARGARLDVRGALQKIARVRGRPFGTGEEVLGHGYGKRDGCVHSFFSIGERVSDGCTGRVFRGREAAENPGAGNSGKSGAAGDRRKQGRGQGSSGGMAADNVNFANAGFKGALGGFEFQNHAAGDYAGLHELVELFAGNGRENFIAIEDAGNIGEVNEMVSLYKLGAGRGHVIGIDVVEFAVGTEAEAWSNRNELLSPKRFEKTHIDAGEIAHIAEAAFDVVVHEGRGRKAGRVRGRDAHSGLAFGGNGGGEPFIQQSGKNHYRDVAGFSIRNPQSGNKLAFDAETFEGGSEKAAAAVNHQDFVALARERGDMLG